MKEDNTKLEDPLFEQKFDYKSEKDYNQSNIEHFINLFYAKMFENNKNTPLKDVQKVRESKMKKNIFFWYQLQENEELNSLLDKLNFTLQYRFKTKFKDAIIEYIQTPFNENLDLRFIYKEDPTKRYLFHFVEPKVNQNKLNEFAKNLLSESQKEAKEKKQNNLFDEEIQMKEINPKIIQKQNQKSDFFVQKFDYQSQKDYIESNAQKYINLFYTKMFNNNLNPSYINLQNVQKVNEIKPEKNTFFWYQLQENEELENPFQKLSCGKLLNQLTHKNIKYIQTSYNKNLDLRLIDIKDPSKRVLFHFVEPKQIQEKLLEEFKYFFGESQTEEEEEEKNHYRLNEEIQMKEENDSEDQHTSDLGEKKGIEMQDEEDSNYEGQQRKKKKIEVNMDKDEQIPAKKPSLNCANASSEEIILNQSFNDFKSFQQSQIGYQDHYLLVLNGKASNTMKSKIQDLLDCIKKQINSNDKLQLRILETLIPKE